ncbi:MAG: M20/M25/M40 family metallo-hydrolase, partial [Phycisphaerae bacterium]
GANAYGIPALHITRKVADAQLKRAGLDSLSTLEDRLDAGSYVSAELKGVSASGTVVFKHFKTPTYNVVGILRGTDRDNEEFVVVGAHYDHLGLKAPTMRTFKDGKLVKTRSEPQIHHGADDNASGTSGVIEIARMLAAGPRPRRSLVFVAFTAEETGLHGSKRFVEEPPVPLGKVVAMLNMDMIGRLDPETKELTVFGTGTAGELPDILKRAAAGSGLKVATSASAGGRSDHASFVRHRIPSLHFYTGNNPDYHKPSDTADKINADGGAKITRIVGQIVRELADGTQKLAFVEVEEPKRERPSGDTPVYRVVMGLAPAYAEDEKPGMAVDAVTAQGPAAMAGMKPGDRIILIGGKKIANIYDYMASTRGNKPGDAVEVVVLRDGRELKLLVTLAAAG